MKQLELTLSFLLALLLAGCGGSDEPQHETIVLEKNKISIAYNGEASIKLTSGDLDKCTVKGNDDFIATVVRSDEIIIYANHVGKTEFTVSDGNSSAKCTVEVTPMTTVVATPLLNFNLSAEDIKGYAKTLNATDVKTNEYLDISMKYDNQTDIYCMSPKAIMSYVRYYYVESYSDLLIKYTNHLGERYKMLSTSSSSYVNFSGHRIGMTTVWYSYPNKEYVVLRFTWSKDFTDSWPEVYLIYGSSKSDIEDILYVLKDEYCNVYPADRRFYYF